MTHSFSRLSVVVVGLGVLAGWGCYDSGPSRVYPPKFDSAAGQKAVEQYGDKLDKVPSLVSAGKLLDVNGDGKITAEKINARIKAWLETKIGRMPLRCKIMHNGCPLAKATVVFEPEKFLGPDVKEGKGTTDAAGGCTISAPPNKAGDPSNTIAPGFYRVKVTKAGENIPAKYNAETILGQEIAVDNPKPAEGGARLHVGVLIGTVAEQSADNFRPAGRPAHVDGGDVCGPRLIRRRRPLDEVVGRVGADDCHGAAAEAGPGHAGAIAGRMGGGAGDHRVQRFAGDLVVVAQACVALIHQLAQRGNVAAAHRRSGGHGAVVLGDDVPGSAARGFVQFARPAALNSSIVTSRRAFDAEKRGRLFALPAALVVG